MEQRPYGNVVAAGVTGAEASVDIFGNTQITDFITRQTLAGRVFIAGHGIEQTITDGEAALSEVTPTYALIGPSGDRVAIPLWVRFKLSTEGGAAPDAYLTYVDFGGEGPAVSAVGTELTTLCTLGGVGNTHAAKCSIGVTHAAVTDTQNVNIWEATNLLDNLISGEGATTVVGVDSTGGHMTAHDIPLFPRIPIALHNGSLLNFYSSTGTSDSKWAFTICWTEVDAVAT